MATTIQQLEAEAKERGVKVYVILDEIVERELLKLYQKNKN